MDARQAKVKKRTTALDDDDDDIIAKRIVERNIK